MLHIQIMIIVPAAANNHFVSITSVSTFEVKHSTMTVGKQSSEMEFKLS